MAGLGELETVTYTDRTAGSFRITGQLVGSISTKFGAPSQGMELPRKSWGVNTVYRTPSGPYVLVREAYSRIYHQAGSPCRTVNQMPKGEEMTVAQMRKELQDKLGMDLPMAVSCDTCRPAWPEDLDDGDRVRYEVYQCSVFRCPQGPPQVIQGLTKSTRRGGVIQATVPAPARALIELCEANDPDWMEYEAPVEVIS